MARHPRKGNGWPAQLAAVNLDAAGSAIGAQAHGVAVPPASEAAPVRRFGAGRVEVAALASGRQHWGVTPVARASSGGYGIPLGEVRDARGFRGGSRGAGSAARPRAAQA